jgi:hypothetical protein
MTKPGYVQWSLWVPTQARTVKGKWVELDRNLDVVTEALDKANVRYEIVERDSERRRIGGTQQAVFALQSDLRKARMV